MPFFISSVRNPLSACPPSSRVSPFCLRQSPTGRATLGSRTLSDVASLCHSLRWCKKNRAHPQLRTLVWCSALPSSSPLLLAFRLRKSKCLSKNPPNKQSAYCFSPQLTVGEYHARSAYNSRSEYNFAKQNITHKKSTLRRVLFLPLIFQIRQGVRRGLLVHR